MPNISYIGKEYESAFNSICELYRNGYISQGILEQVNLSEKEITYRDTVFALRPYEEQNNDLSAVMTEKGASWFEKIRNMEKVDSGASDWLALIADVAEDYHKHNSFLEFCQKDHTIEKETINRQITDINAFLQKFYPHLDDTQIVVGKGENATVDIYAVNFLMDINNGVGEFQKVLGKVYFKYMNRKYFLLRKEEGNEIEQQIRAVIETNDFENAETGSDITRNSTVINEVLAELDRVIRQGQFTEAVVFAGEKDLRIIEHYLSNGPQISVTLDCLHLRVYAIHHIRWTNTVYQVERHQVPLLYFLANSANQLTVSCARCREEEDGILMVDNRIEYEKDGIRKSVFLDFSRKDLGIDEEQVFEIQQMSDFSKHLLPVRCSDVGMREHNIDCVRYICERDGFEYNGKRYCRDCTHPKIVFRDHTGEAKLTATMGYASDLNSFAEYSDLRKCRICGRSFFHEFESAVPECALCGKIRNGTVGQGENVYAEYRDLFSLAKRIFVHRAGTVAIEDGEVVIFRIKSFGRTHYYIYDKLSMLKKGYLDGPKKLQFFGGD